MALDPSIILGYRPTQVESPLNALGQALKIKGYQQETDMGALKMQDMERERSADNALAQLISAGGKPEDIATGLATKGYGKQSLAYTKQQQELAKQRADIDKTGAETGKLKTEALNAKVKLSRDALATINDPQSAASWVAAMYQDPEFAPLTAKSGRTLEQAVAAIPRDPEGFRAWKMQSSLGAEKLVEYTTPTANTVATNNTSIATNAATNARVAAEGAANRKQAQSHFDAGQNGVKYEKDADGNLVAVPVKPAAGGPIVGRPVMGMDGKPLAAGGGGKAMTEGQAKANLFGTRMQEADKVLAAMEKEGVLRPGSIKGVAETVGNIAGLGTESMGGALADAAGNLTNWTQSSEQQRVEQAQRDFINADLRRESGASISPAEFRNGQKQYFPQPGDDSKTLAQKARNRQIATQGILAEVPEKQRTKPAPAEPEVPTAFSDAGKESRYQAWKRSQGGK